MIQHDMYYNLHEDQWFVNLRGKEYALNCGENMELHIEGKAIPCRLELADKWYVIMGNVSLDLREKEKYAINL